MGDPNANLAQRGVAAAYAVPWMWAHVTLVAVAIQEIGAAGFIGRETVAPEGGGLVGYPIASLSVSVYADYVLWENYNNKHFTEWGLGSYP